VPWVSKRAGFPHQNIKGFPHQNKKILALALLNARVNVQKLESNNSDIMQTSFITNCTGMEDKVYILMYITKRNIK